MSNIFNFNRFRKLFIKHTTENYRNYLMSAAVFTGILVLLYGFVILTGGSMNHKFRVSVLAILYLIVGAIFTSTVFSEYSRKNTAIVALTLPASHFEKFMVGWIYSYVIYTIVFAICYSLVDFTYLQFTNQSNAERILFNVLPGEDFLMVVFRMFTMLHGIVLFGAIYFRGAHFVKTALSFFAGMALLCVFHFSFLQAIIPANKIGFTPPFFNGLVLISDLKSDDLVRLDKSELEIFTWILFIGFTAALWLASFLQLKEKQI